jgi:hypothetical protein
MFDAHEVFILLVSTGVLVLTIILFKQLVLAPYWKILLTAFILYYFSMILTVVEGFLLPDFMNFLEHFCRSLFPGMVLLWSLALARDYPSSGGRP